MAQDLEAFRLHQEAQTVLQARGIMSEADFWRIANQKGHQIAEFLQRYGDSLDQLNPAIVDMLGKDFDALAKGVRETVGAAQKSPVWEGTKAGLKDAWDRVNRWVGGDPKNDSPLEKGGRMLLVGLGLWLGIEAIRTFRK